MRRSNLFLNFVLAVFSIFSFSFKVAAQNSSMGPGKGPAVAGAGSKYTYPQPGKPSVYSMKSIRPAYQIPENPEKYTWLLTSKVDGRDPVTPTDNVPVYSFLFTGKRVQVGYAKVGDEIIMEDIRPVGKAVYYRYAWKGGKPPEKDGTPGDYWVSGSNIEFAGNK